MKTYGKWEWSGSDYRRKVTSNWWGFVRETWQVASPKDYGSDRRVLRVLNGEPEPEVKLDDKNPAVWHAFRLSWFDGTEPVVDDYRFPTAALKAELKRRGEKKL